MPACLAARQVVLYACPIGVVVIGLMAAWFWFVMPLLRRVQQNRS